LSRISLNDLTHASSLLCCFFVTGALLAFFLYPDIGYLFVVSPIACFGVIYFLNQINTKDIDHNAARGLTTEVSTGNSNKKKLDKQASSEYLPPSSSNNSISTSTQKGALTHKPSFVLGIGGAESHQSRSGLKAETPLQVLRDPTLLVFLFIVFLFHTANGTVLPLVMQTLAIGNGGSGILMSGLCIIVAQVSVLETWHLVGD
jgi:hypothetical protein